MDVSAGQLLLLVVLLKETFLLVFPEARDADCKAGSPTCRKQQEEINFEPTL